jgi:hypothetical protein
MAFITPAPESDPESDHKHDGGVDLELAQRQKMPPLAKLVRLLSSRFATRKTRLVVSTCLSMETSLAHGLLPCLSAVANSSEEQPADTKFLC